MGQKTKHTPGPWIIRYAKNITAVGTPKGEMQLSLHGVYDGLKPLSVDLHEWKANAALIAAAPAMYEALREAHELIRSLVAEEMIHGTELQRVGNCQANMWSALAQAEGVST